MRILNIHAHFDDFEFTAAGTFEMLRRRWGDALQARVIVCTDGQAGHHFRTRRETGRLRMREQRESARLGGYDFKLLRYPNGQVPREACLSVDRPLMAALWKAIRDFEPDYLLCPPLPHDPLLGIHIDHVAIAEAIRKVAYLINVPHCYTPEYPSDERHSKPCRVPAILNVYDGYMAGKKAYHLAVDVEPAFEKICQLTFCHRSQIMEWLPWVGRHAMSPPQDLADWNRMMRARLRQRNRELGLPAHRAAEVFAVTQWGEVPSLADVRRDFPNLLSLKKPSLPAPGH